MKADQEAMTYSEWITIAIAFVALVVSAVALRRAGRANTIAQEANELAQAPANLAKIQLQQEEARRSKTALSLSLEKRQSIGGNGKLLTSYKFCLTNGGEVVAKNAGFEILSEESPLIARDYESKLPALLLPRQSIEVLAAVHMGSPSKLDAVIFWTNPDGSEERQECVVTM